MSAPEPMPSATPSSWSWLKAKSRMNPMAQTKSTRRHGVSNEPGRAQAQEPVPARTLLEGHHDVGGVRGVTIQRRLGLGRERHVVDLGGAGAPGCRHGTLGIDDSILAATSPPQNVNLSVDVSELCSGPC